LNAGELLALRVSEMTPRGRDSGRWLGAPALADLDKDESDYDRIAPDLS
jgi:hypothetical protein